MGFPTGNIKTDYVKFEFYDSGGTLQGTSEFSNFEIPDELTETENAIFGTLESRAGLAYQTRETIARAFTFTIRTAEPVTFNKLLTFLQLLRNDYRVKLTLAYYQIYQPVTEDLQVLIQVINAVAIEIPTKYRAMVAGEGLLVDFLVPVTVKNSEELTAPTTTQIIGTGGNAGRAILVGGSTN